MGEGGGRKAEECTNNLLKEFEDIDKKEGEGGIIGNEVNKRESLRREVGNRLHMKEMSWKQKVERGG